MSNLLIVQLFYPLSTNLLYLAHWAHIPTLLDLGYKSWPYIYYTTITLSCVWIFFFFFPVLIDQGKRVNFFFFFHLDPHFYFSKMEKMKRKIWREGECIILHLITFFLFLLHFIFLSAIKKKKKNTCFQLIIIYEYTIIYGDGLLSMPLRPWPKAPISKNLYFYF